MSPKLSAAYKPLFQIPHLTIPRKERKHGCGRWLYHGPLPLIFKIYEESLFERTWVGSELITQVHMSLWATGFQGCVCQQSHRSCNMSSAHLFHSLDGASQQGVGLALQWPFGNVWRHSRCHPGGLLLASSVEIRNIAQHPLMHKGTHYKEELSYSKYWQCWGWESLIWYFIYAMPVLLLLFFSF